MVYYVCYVCYIMFVMYRCNVWYIKGPPQGVPKEASPHEFLTHTFLYFLCSRTTAPVSGESTLRVPIPWCLAFVAGGTLEPDVSRTWMGVKARPVQEGRCAKTSQLTPTWWATPLAR